MAETSYEAEVKQEPDLEETKPQTWVVCSTQHSPAPKNDDIKCTKWTMDGVFSGSNTQVIPQEDVKQESDLRKLENGTFSDNND